MCIPTEYNYVCEDPLSLFKSETDATLMQCKLFRLNPERMLL